MKVLVYWVHQCLGCSTNISPCICMSYWWVLAAAPRQALRWSSSLLGRRRVSHSPTMVCSAGGWSLVLSVGRPASGEGGQHGGHQGEAARWGFCCPLYGCRVLVCRRRQSLFDGPKGAKSPRLSTRGTCVIQTDKWAELDCLTPPPPPPFDNL